MGKYVRIMVVSLFFAAVISYTAYWCIIKSCQSFYISFKKNDEIFRQHLDYDVLLLGSSRMEHTVNPRILDSVLGCHSYNAGAEGATLVEMKMLLQACLRLHAKPKLIVISLDFSAMNTGEKFIFYPVYLPYADVREVEDELIKQRIPTKLYSIVPFMRLTEMDDYYKGALIKVITRKTELSQNDFFYRGYVSNGVGIVVNENKLNPVDIPVTEAGKQALRDICNISTREKIELAFTYSPEYNFNNQKNIRNFKEVMNFYKSVAESYQIKYWRNDSLSMCKVRNYFANAGHVNREGADIYSAILAGQLKQSYIVNYPY